MAVTRKVRHTAFTAALLAKSEARGAYRAPTLPTVDSCQLSEDRIAGPTAHRVAALPAPTRGVLRKNHVAMAERAADVAAREANREARRAGKTPTVTVGRMADIVAAGDAYTLGRDGRSMSFSAELRETGPAGFTARTDSTDSAATDRVGDRMRASVARTWSADHAPR